MAWLRKDFDVAEGKLYRGRGKTFDATMERLWVRPWQDFDTVEGRLWHGRGKTFDTAEGRLLTRLWKDFGHGRGRTNGTFKFVAKE